MITNFASVVGICWIFLILNCVIISACLDHFCCFKALTDDEMVQPQIRSKDGPRTEM